MSSQKQRILKQKMRAVSDLKGIWADREDMMDSEAWVKKQRKKMSNRYNNFLSLFIKILFKKKYFYVNL